MLDLCSRFPRAAVVCLIGVLGAGAIFALGEAIHHAGLNFFESDASVEVPSTLAALATDGAERGTGE
jgi:hypothetical protein